MIYDECKIIPQLYCFKFQFVEEDWKNVVVPVSLLLLHSQDPLYPLHHLPTHNPIS
jgi:cellobiose-specific phosphotransferase system component IIA